MRIKVIGDAVGERVKLLLESGSPTNTTMVQVDLTPEQALNLSYELATKLEGMAAVREKMKELEDA